MLFLNWNVERPQIGCSKSERKINRVLSFAPAFFVLTETNTTLDFGSHYQTQFTEPSHRKPGPCEAVAGIYFDTRQFELVDQKETSDPTEAVCVLLNSQIGKILLYASIIPYHGYRGKDGNSPFWSEHRQAIEWHKSDWTKLAKETEMDHMLVAGDYNQHRDGVGKYGSKAIRNQLSEAFSDANLTCITEQDFKATGLSRRSVDHVALSQKLASQILDVKAFEGKDQQGTLSDHNGITVEIGL